MEVGRIGRRVIDNARIIPRWYDLPQRYRGILGVSPSLNSVGDSGRIFAFILLRGIRLPFVLRTFWTVTSFPTCIGSPGNIRGRICGTHDTFHVAFCGTIFCRLSISVGWDGLCTFGQLRWCSFN